MNNDHKDTMYLALKENMINSLESNEFYDLFNSSIKAGTNNLSLYQRYMDNVIDPKWIQAIEDAIIPLDNIIRNPRRFIKQEEEVVPIEQAKKISQESIRHLAQHTNMIQTVDKDGSVTPNKILNILKEETYATYEKRFIFTLLKHIQYFIDKRLKILTDSKVLTENKISVQSEFNLGNEKIKYEFALSSTEKTEKKRVYVLFENQMTYSVFQFSEICKDTKEYINFIPLNYYEMWAQKVFAAPDPTNLIGNGKSGEDAIDYFPLDMLPNQEDKHKNNREPNRKNDLNGTDVPPEDIKFISDHEDDKHYVHLVVIGMTKMGVAMALEAAHLCHYPNCLTAKAPRTRITFIEENGDRE